MFETAHFVEKRVIIKFCKIDPHTKKVPKVLISHVLLCVLSNLSLHFFLKVKKKIRYTFPSSILKCVIKFVCFVELKTYYYTLFGNTTYCAFVKKKVQ